MAVTVRNNTRQLLIVTLNSGMTLHLPPGGASAPLDDLELNDNPKVAKLSGAGDLTVLRNDPAATAPTPAPDRAPQRPRGHRPNPGTGPEDGP